MPYPRLTAHAHPVPTGTFAFCQVCGVRRQDLTEVRLYEECDDEDQREPGNYILIGKKCCKQKMQRHPRGYLEVPWGRGEPGALILLCGDCPHRSGFKCVHPHAKSNGGNGILVAKHSPLGEVHVNFGRKSGYLDLSVYNQCEGHPTKNKVPTESP